MTIPGDSLETLKAIKFIIPTIKSHIPFFSTSSGAPTSSRGFRFYGVPPLLLTRLTKPHEVGVGEG